MGWTSARTAVVWGMLSLSLTGCYSGLQIMREQQQLKLDIQLAKEKRALECAPVELAKAEANLAFTELEMRSGDPRRATAHIATGRESLLEVQQRVAECAPPAPKAAPPPLPKDSDRDGIVDSVDKCPDRPEDLDGVEDEDGCPEAPRDRDQDGLADAQDRCPDQPEDRDGVEDEDGCPETSDDRDRDGLADSVDKCPDQPEDRDGFEDQDGCPDPDNDADGIFDTADTCPQVPEDSDGFEDQDGCPEADNDRDGLVDAQDRCPNEAETLNSFQDEDGCPDAKPEASPLVTVTQDQIRINEQIKFKLGSDVILPESFAILNAVAGTLKGFPQMKIRVEGHTDAQGTEVYNLDLSKRRAASVRKYLLNAGIAQERVSSVGLGESLPLDTNDTEAGRANNRRVEFHITER